MSKISQVYKDVSGWFKPSDNPEKFGNSLFYAITGNSSIIWNQRNYLKDFLEVPEVNSIISWKYRAFSNMKISIVSKTTGKEVNNQEETVRRFRNPNYFQSQKEFMMQTKAFREIFGIEYLYFLTPVGMPNSLKGIFTIPPQLVTTKIKDKTPYFLRDRLSDENGYSITWNDSTIPLPKDSIIVINNPKVGITPDNYLQADAVMSAQQAPIRNIRAAYEARNVLIENRGALGILSNAGKDGTGSMLPMDVKEKKDLQDSFAQYGMTKKQWQVIITNLNLSWQQMAIDADKLQLFEETREDFTKLCDGFGVNFELFGSQKGVTFANKQQAEKNTYQDTMIPEGMEWIDALNRRYETANKSWMISGSFAHLPILQEDLNARASTLNIMIDALSKAVDRGFTTQQVAIEELKKFGL